MDFLLIILIIVIIAMVMPKPGEPGGVDDKLVVQKKRCPPHQWFWQEIVDQDGNKQGERICCRVCGPLQSQSNREENEG